MSIIQENIQRNAILDAKYDPYLGIGSTIERQLFSIADLEEPVNLPLSMLNIPWIQKLGEAKSIREYINRHRYEHEELALSYDPEEMLQDIFFNARLDNDFEYWTAMCAMIKPKKGGNFIPFVLNYPQRLLWKEQYEMIKNELPIFFVLLKSRQFGGSTEIDILSSYIQIRLKTNWNSLIAAHINQAATNIRSMTANLFKFYPKEVDDISLKPFEGTHNIKIIPERSNKITIGSMETPDSTRSDDLKIAHVSELGLMKTTQGKSPEDLIQSIIGTLPMDEPLTMFAIESTAKGVGNSFHNIWLQASAGKNGMKPVFIPWLMDQKNRIDFKPGENIQEFFDSLDNYELFLWQKGATLEGIKFYRKQLGLFNGDKWRMQSEFPTTCIASGMRVGTNKGIIKIEEVFDSIECANGIISNFKNNGLREIFKITTKKGYFLKCTADHLIMVNNEWKRLDKITVGDSISLSSPMFSKNICSVDVSSMKFVKSTIEVNEELARFIGIYMGDGSFSGKSLSIACDAKDHDFVVNTRILIEKLFGCNSTERLIGKNKGCCEIRLNKTELTYYFDSLGIIEIRNSDRARIRKVCVPDCIWKSPRHIVKEFLKGIFETDGFCGYGVPKIGLFSKHRDFLEDIQLLLLGFGITSNLKSRNAINGTGYEYIANTLILQGEQADLYCKHIGFLSDRKNSIFDSWGIRNDTKRTKNVMYDEVVSIESSGIENVYDITVDISHRFDANGLLVHNCEEAFQSTGNRFFPPQYVLALRKDNKEPIFKGEIVGDSTLGKKALENIRFEKNERGNLWIWEMPDTNNRYDNRYVVPMDIGGASSGADFSIIRVIDRLPMLTGGDPKAVLTWKGHIDQDLLAWKAIQIAKIYDNALFIPEDNSLEKETDGEHFQTILNKIKDDYRNIYIRNDEEKVGNDFVPKYGWNTNKKSKGLALDALKACARERMNKDLEAEGTGKQDGYCYVEYDSRQCDEMDCYEIKQNGSLGAVDGAHDDECMTTAIGLHASINILPLPKLKRQEDPRPTVRRRSESSF